MAKKGRKVNRRDRIAGGGFNPAQTRTLMEDLIRSEAYYTEPNVIPQDSPAAQDRIRIVGPVALFVTTDMGGNPQTSPNVDNWSRRDFVVRDLSEEQSQIELVRAYAPLRDGDTGDPATVTLWCTLGAEIEGYTIYYEINNPNAATPFGGTWNTWEVSGDSGVPVEIPEGGGTWYRSNQRFETSQGRPQNATDWFQYVTEPDTANTAIERVITVEEFAAIQQVNTPQSAGTSGTTGRRGRHR